MQCLQTGKINQKDDIVGRPETLAYPCLNSCLAEDRAGGKAASSAAEDFAGFSCHDGGKMVCSSQGGPVTSGDPEAACTFQKRCDA